MNLSFFNVCFRSYNSNKNNNIQISTNICSIYIKIAKS